MDTSFQFIWENTRNVIAGSYGKRMFSFVRNCLTIPKWLYYFAFSPAVTESSFCFISSPAFDIISVLDFEHSKTCVVVSRCGLIFIVIRMSQLITNDVEYVFMYLLAIYLFIYF